HQKGIARAGIGTVADVASIMEALVSRIITVEIGGAVNRIIAGTTAIAGRRQRHQYAGRGPVIRKPVAIIVNDPRRWAYFTRAGFVVTIRSNAVSEEAIALD